MDTITQIAGYMVPNEAGFLAMYPVPNKREWHAFADSTRLEVYAREHGVFDSCSCCKAGNTDHMYDIGLAKNCDDCTDECMIEVVPIEEGCMDVWWHPKAFHNDVDSEFRCVCL